MGFWEFIDQSGWRVFGLFLLAYGALLVLQTIAKALGGKYWKGGR